MNDRILVTGATGFLGARLVEHLLQNENDIHIIATGRKFSTDNKITNPRLKYLLGDLSDETFVKSLFEHKINVVINCASLSSPWGSPSAFERANITTQQNLICESTSNSIQRFIYISSPSVYFNFKNAINISEDDSMPSTMVNQYAKTKYRAEALLENSGLKYIILRPRALIGRGDTVIMPRLIRSHKEGKLKIMGDGKNMVDLTSVSNMVEAIRLSMHTTHTDEAYNISNGEPVNLWDSINEVLEAIGLTPITDKISYPILYSIASLMEFKGRIFKESKEPVLTKYSVGVLAKSFTFDISKARKKLKYKPLQSTSDAIAEFAAWYKKQNNETT